MKKIILVIFCVTFALQPSFSGELANFEIVGFSEDMRYFSFAEYGLSEESTPFSNLFIVNVQQNYFVNNGIYQNAYNIKTQLEEDGSGAFLNTVLQAAPVLRQYNINPLNKGKLVYLLLDGEVPKPTLTFTDFDTNTAYTVELRQTNNLNSLNQPESSFHINLGINYAGRSYSYTVGNPSFVRKPIKQYVLRSIYTSLNNRSIIFVVEKHSPSRKPTGDTNIHYMIESITWR